MPGKVEIWGGWVKGWNVENGLKIGALFRPFHRRAVLVLGDNGGCYALGTNFYANCCKHIYLNHQFLILIQKHME